MSHPRRKHAEHEEEEHENHERWLVSYADMITVLMALFVVMFAISVVDQGKFASLKISLSSSLGQKITVLEGGKKPSAGASSGEGALNFGDALLPPTSPQMAAQVSRAVADAKARDARAEDERARAAVEREVHSLEETRRRIIRELEKKKLAGSVRFRYDERGLVVSVVTDKVLFAPNRAELSTTGRRVLRTIGPVLRGMGNELLVEGHTDTTKAGPKYYATEWELSSARATTVVRTLIDVTRIQPKRLSATGHADQRPLVPGTSPTANRINRRVEIVIVSSLAPKDRALLPVIAPSVISRAGKE